MTADHGTDGTGGGLGPELSDLAYSLEITPVPFEDVLRGGRRRRTRRRLLLLSAATVATAAVLGTTLGTGLGADLTADRTSVTAAAVPATPHPSHPSHPGTAHPAPTASGRNPLQPVTVMLAQGTSGGHTWKAWADLWPAGPESQDLAQLQAMDAVRVRAIPQLPPATQSDADRTWQANTDQVNLYVTLDGKRIVDDTVESTPAPGGTASTSTHDIEGDSLGGSLLGFKGAEMGSTPVLLAEVGADAASVVVTWQDGTTSHPAVVRVGDSPVRWFAVARKPGQSDRNIKVYDAHGKLLLTDSMWFH